MCTNKIEVSFDGFNGYSMSDFTTYNNLGKML